MGSTQYYLAQSLDGYIAESDGRLEWLTGYVGDSALDAPDQTGGGYEAFFAEVGALAMGSATYEFILAEGSGWPYGATPSWVFTSRDLPELQGADIRFAHGDVRPVHDGMRSAAGSRNIWIVGGGGVAMQFADQGLLEELVVTVVPVVLGEGIATFPRRLRQRLRLTAARPSRNGLVELRYEFVR